MTDIPFNNKFFNPFEGHSYNKISPYGTNVPTQNNETYSGLYNSKNIRSLGIRTPSIFVGWGYDLQGRPVSNEYFKNQEGGIVGVNNSSYLKATNQAVNHKGYYSGIIFSSTGAVVPSGGAIPESNYVAGPLDIRFDYYSGFWRSSEGSVASMNLIQGSSNNIDIPLSFSNGVSTANWIRTPSTVSKAYFFGTFTSGGLGSGDLSLPNYDYRTDMQPSGFGISNLAVNISEPFEAKRFLRSHSSVLSELVNMKFLRFSDSEDILPVFSRKAASFNTEFLAEITGSSSAGVNKWSYSWKEIEFINNKYIFKLDGREGSNAYNLQEYNNVDTSIGYGEDSTSDLEIDIVVKPIQLGSKILIRLISYIDAQGKQQTREQFSVGPNPVDISCGNTGACCDPGGTCSILSVDECHNINGTYLGRRTLCSASSSSENALDCSLLTGACCKINDTCIVTTSLKCLNLSGVFKGFGTVCDGSCDVAKGCCNSGFLATKLECAQLNGHYHGDGTDCDVFGVMSSNFFGMEPYLTSNSGWCCKKEPLETFSFLYGRNPSVKFRCEATINPRTGGLLLPGYYYGDFVNEANVCSIRGACCVVGGQCEDLYYPQDCTSNDVPGVRFGFFMGPDTRCQDVVCV